MITPISAFGECFTKDYPATIDYQYQTDIVSPITGFVVWRPQLGMTYNPIFIEQDPVAPDQYLMNKEQNKEVVAYVSNESLWSRFRLSNRDRLFSARTRAAAKTMIAWQHQMREQEDFLFTVQQGQDIPIRRRSEDPSKIMERIDNSIWYKSAEDKTIPPGPSFDQKRFSVQRRNEYSDYMRAFELPKLADAAEYAEIAAGLRERIARGDLQQGRMTCPIACVVMTAHVQKGQHVNAGERIATVASVKHKKATINLPANHVALHLDPRKVTYRVTIKQERPALSFASIDALPDVIDNPPITLKGTINSLPVRRDRGMVASVEINLSDENDGARLLDTLGQNTSITLTPEEYASASPDEQKQLERKISKVGLSCE